MSDLEEMGQEQEKALAWASNHQCKHFQHHCTSTSNPDSIQGNCQQNREPCIHPHSNHRKMKGIQVYQHHVMVALEPEQIHLQSQCLHSLSKPDQLPHNP